MYYLCNLKLMKTTGIAGPTPLPGHGKQANVPSSGPFDLVPFYPEFRRRGRVPTALTHAMTLDILLPLSQP